MTPQLNFLLTRDLRKSDRALQTGGFQGGSAVHKLIRAARYPYFHLTATFQSNHSPQRVG